MEDRKLTEKESLEVITSMIARTKQRYIGDGNIMLMWGYLCVAVAAAIWILTACTHNGAWSWLWFLIWIIGGTATPIMAKKHQIESHVKTYSDKVTSRIWSAVGFSGIAAVFICLAFLLLGGKDAWASMFVFAMVIVPFAEIAQGIVIGEKSLIAGGAVGLFAGLLVTCCIAAGVPLYFNMIIPLFMIAFICMMVIPGHILNHKAHKEI